MSYPQLREIEITDKIDPMTIDRLDIPLAIIAELLHWAHRSKNTPPRPFEAWLPHRTPVPQTTKRWKAKVAHGFSGHKR